MQTLAPAEPGVREFEAAVREADGREVVLDRTYFYAESGGQPADRGTLAGVEVTDVRAVDGRVVHTLAETPGVAVGETVTGVVDDEFRTYCMRAHTASHALYGAGRRLLDDLGYGGFDISTEKVRVDFATPTDLDDDTLVELERLTNRVVWESRDVSWEELPVDEARSREEVAFNTRTEEGVMADADTVRIVTVDDWDVAACGGTHVQNTREIGPVSVLDRSNPGEGLTRVEFAVGPTGIDRLAAVHGAALDAASAFGTGVDELAETARSVVDERDALREEVDELRSELLGRRIADFPTVDRDGAVWRLGTVDGAGPNDVADPARAAVGDGDGDGNGTGTADVVVVAGREGRSFVVVASDGAVDAGEVVDELTTTFGGGGGGGPTFAQGGGIDADPEAIVDELR
jgi:alanyl-tRNA synthetase